MYLDGNALGAAAYELVNLVGLQMPQQPVASLPLVLDVGGGTESPACAGHHEGTHLTVAGHIVQGGVQLLEHLVVQCVEPLRAVEGEPGHMIVLFENDGLISQF